MCAFALRPQLIVIGPLLPLITADLSLSYTAASLLVLIPLVSMGLFALPAARVASIVGPRTGLALCLAGIAAFGIARAVGPGAVSLILLTIPVGVAMGLGGALLPGYVKRRFADRPAFATGVYTGAFQVSSALTGLLAVPIALAIGGWRGAALAISIPALISLVAWLALTERDRGEAIPGSASSQGRAAARLPWRSAMAWTLALTFGLRAMIFQSLVAWLPSIYVERGWDEPSAGALVFLLILSNIPTTFAATWLADRIGSRRSYLAGASLALMVATIGLAVAPEAVYLWVVVVGASLGVLFPLTLTLPLDVADTPATVAGTAGIMLAGGYLIAAIGPLIMGSVRDLSGGFGPALVGLGFIAVALMLVTLLLSPERLARRRGSALSDAVAES